MQDMMNWLAEEEDGQGLVEYALIIALIALAVVAALTTMGTKVSGLFTSISGKLNAPA